MQQIFLLGALGFFCNSASTCFAKSSRFSVPLQIFKECFTQVHVLASLLFCFKHSARALSNRPHFFIIAVLCAQSFVDWQINKVQTKKLLLNTKPSFSTFFYYKGFAHNKILNTSLSLIWQVWQRQSFLQPIPLHWHQSFVARRHRFASF